MSELQSKKFDFDSVSSVVLLIRRHHPVRAFEPPSPPTTEFAAEGQHLLFERLKDTHSNQLEK